MDGERDVACAEMRSHWCYSSFLGGIGSTSIDVFIRPSFLNLKMDWTESVVAGQVNMLPTERRKVFECGKKQEDKTGGTEDSHSILATWVLEKLQHWWINSQFGQTYPSADGTVLTSEILGPTWIGLVEIAKIWKSTVTSRDQANRIEKIGKHISTTSPTPSNMRPAKLRNWLLLLASIVPTSQVKIWSVIRITGR